MRKPYALFLIFVFAAVICLCSCTGPYHEDVSGAKIVRINTSATIASCIQQTIQMNRLLEKYLPGDVALEWTNIAATPDIRDALVANKIDIGSFSVASYISTIENGMPLVILSGTLPQTNELVTTRSDINSFSDITERHKIVMLSRGSSAELAFALRCKEVFGDPVIYSQNIVIVPNTEMAAMIRGADEYDLYAPAFPFLQQMLELDNVRLIDGLTDTAVRYCVGSVIVATEGFREKNPTVIDAFHKAAGEAVEYLNGNTEEAAQRLASLYGEDVDPEDVVAVLKKCPPSLAVSGYDEIADLLLEMGILAKPAKRFSELPYYDEIPKE